MINLSKEVLEFIKFRKTLRNSSEHSLFIRSVYGKANKNNEIYPTVNRNNEVYPGDLMFHTDSCKMYTYVNGKYVELQNNLDINTIYYHPRD